MRRAALVFGAVAVLGTPVVARAQVVRDGFVVANGPVRATAISGKTLYIGGDFTAMGPVTGGGVPVDSITGAPLAGFPRVHGEVWTVVADGAGGWYFGGVFTAVGGL